MTDNLQPPATSNATAEAPQQPRPPGSAPAASAGEAATTSTATTTTETSPTAATTTTTTTAARTTEGAPADGAAGLAAALSAVASLAALALSNPGAVPPATHFCIDVECVATGTTHNDRAVAQIALVDQYERVLLNVLVRPDRPVASYLTPLTGITREDVELRGVPLDRALGMLRAALPRRAVLVGQNIMQDVRWLGLSEGNDFASLVDLQGLFRVWNPKYKTFSVWSQDHLAATLLGWPPASEGTAHDAAADAAKSMRLFALREELRRNRQSREQSEAAWRVAEERLLASAPAPSFAKRNPSFEGVCMGGRKTCTCGAAFLGGF